MRTIRRQIFDALGPAARATGKPAAPVLTEAQRLERGLALLGESEILLLACQPSLEFVNHSIAEALLANRDVLLDMFRNGASITPKTLPDKVEKLKPLPSQLYGLALARQEWSRLRNDVYLDRLNILSYHKHPGVNPQGQLRITEGIDIIANDVAVRPVSGANPFLIRLEQGVLDTNAEGFVLAHAKIAEIRENTAEIFAQSERQGIEWVIIRTANQSTWQTVELPHDVRVRIERDLAEGYVALVPKKSILVEGRSMVGWWRVDPRDGQTLGIGETGWGSELIEYIMEHKVASSILMGELYAITCFGTAVGGGGLTCGEYLQCLVQGVGAGIGFLGILTTASIVITVSAAAGLPAAAVYLAIAGIVVKAGSTGDLWESLDCGNYQFYRKDEATK